MDDDDDKLVSHEVHLRQLSSTPMSALQLRRQSKSLELAKQQETQPAKQQQQQEQQQREQEQEQATVASHDEVDQGVVLRRAIEHGAVTLAQIDDLKLECDNDYEHADDVDVDVDMDYMSHAAGGLSNPAVQTTNDEQITAKVATTTTTAGGGTGGGAGAGGVGSSPGEVSSIWRTAAAALWAN